MAEEAPILMAEDLHKTHQLGRVPVPALRGVSLKVRRGEFLAITGPSGSGKTSLLNLLGLLDEPTQGRVVIDGMEASRMRGATKAKFRLEKLGFVFQFFNLFEELTAVENVILPALARGRRRDQYLTKAAMLLKSLGLADRIRHRPSELSGGEQQRVAVARALINSPIILLTDEPTANVDSATGQRIVEILNRLNKQRKLTIVMVTHERYLAERADRAIELRDGVIVKRYGRE